MTTTITVAREAVGEAYDQALRATEAATHAITQKAVSGRVWLEASDNADKAKLVEISDTASALHHAVAAYLAFEYASEQERSTTVKLAGWFAVAPSCMAEVAHANQRKDALRQTVVALRTLLGCDSSGPDSRAMGLERELTEIGLARVNLLQAYRHIPTLKRTPPGLGFSWVKGEAVVEPASQADAEFFCSGDQGDLDALHTAIERYGVDALAFRRRVPLTLVANAWLDPETKAKLRVRTPLPLVFPHAPDGSVPTVVMPRPPKPRKRRSDAAVGWLCLRHDEQTGRALMVKAKGSDNQAKAE
jgi:hypothetical protein